VMCVFHPSFGTGVDCNYQEIIELLRASSFIRPSGRVWIATL